MTVITDYSELLAVRPVSLTAYAIAEGWRQAERFGEKSFVFVKPGQPELIIPSTDELGDYANVVHDIIDILSNLEKRDQLQVYGDLIGADRDVIRVRAPHSNDDGSIDLDVGVAIFDYSRSMLESAACSATSARAVFRAGSVRKATDYMSKVRLGQTERGSFIATLLAPVPPALERDRQADFWPDLLSEPFDRHVTRKLVDGLLSAKSASEAIIGGEGFQAFNNAVESGVSANLCESLSALIASGKGLEVSVTWARTRPAPESRRTIEFSPSYGPILSEAARVFRNREARPDETLIGFVTKLRRDLGDDTGRITIKSFIDSKAVSVSTSLPPPRYTT